MPTDENILCAALAHGADEEIICAISFYLHFGKRNPISARSSVDRYIWMICDEEGK